MKRLRVYAYGPSNTVKQLVDELNGLLIRREGSKYRYRPHHAVVNWGSSHRPACLQGVPVLNPPEAVAHATSKQATFAVLRGAGLQVPDWTTDRGVAQQWLQDCKVLGRDLDNGSQGRGITLYPRRGELGNHRFYVKYNKKVREFRVHVFGGQPIFTQEKLRKRGVEDANKYIRSHGRGWCFVFRHLVDNPVPDETIATGVEAVKALGLDFGAVDVGWHPDTGTTVFEVNTAPGLEESSLAAYTEALRNALQ